ncbi:DUF4907 domain-containing protein [Formosa sp. PL04]|uniref:DUF4907 domain-containing protein n=1 Tax=Formosa sp. PL04 TaxID=3081755 RepID=UPI002980D7BB|nr:DUF4907 domain-containing protein [Formosa sp. PL04]MDW5288689.1 DUF4907 domain-containing protein [Formosa sp. PL04]
MKNMFKFVLGFGLVMLVMILIFKSDSLTKDAYVARVYTVNSGYGYEISLNHKILIKQDVIPALQSELQFCSASDAKIIADLVIKKLENKINPKITPIELQQNAISLACLN